MTDANEQPQNLCANNCGFYGSPLTSHYCSKCYKERVEVQQLSSAGNSLNLSTLSDNSAVNNNNNSVQVEITTPPLPLLEISPIKKDINKPQKPIQKTGVKEIIRCKECKKRVGFYGFDCKCGLIFCDVHRYSDKHNCNFDYKEVAKKNLSKSNPCIVALKLKDKI